MVSHIKRLLIWDSLLARRELNQRRYGPDPDDWRAVISLDFGDADLQRSVGQLAKRQDIGIYTVAIPPSRRIRVYRDITRAPCPSPARGVLYYALDNPQPAPEANT